MMFKLHLLPFLLFLVFLSCKTSPQPEIVEIKGEQIPVSDAIPQDEEIAEFIEPYKLHIDETMNEVLSYSEFDLRKTDGDLNTAIGNMMADAVMELANPVFKSRTGEDIDMVLLNHGGIRSAIGKGNISTRTAFQVMPFENEVVVATLKAEDVREMVQYLLDAGTPHPISGARLVLGPNNEIDEFLIGGEPLVEGEIYHIATNDYLLQGGDNMVFFNEAINVTEIDYKIRNLLIDYFKSRDTISPVIDDRFIRIE